MIELIISLLVMIIASWLRPVVSDDEQPKSTSPTTRIFLEKIEDQYYAWYMEPQEKFITQSRSLETLFTDIQKIIGNKSMTIKTTKEIQCQLEELKLLRI